MNNSLITSLLNSHITHYFNINIKVEYFHPPYFITLNVQIMRRTVGLAPWLSLAPEAGPDQGLLSLADTNRPLLAIMRLGDHFVLSHTIYYCPSLSIQNWICT